MQFIQSGNVYRHIPNALTALRLLLAMAFFVLLSFYQYEGRGDPTLIVTAFLVYVTAWVTDYLDGHLARKWNVGSTFGRIVDPFADKILVLGAFIFFAGKNFIVPEIVPAGGEAKMVVSTITGVAPGIVVLLLARELLVTSLRGIGESAGHDFGAVWAGKFKMGFQSGTILVILAYVAFRPFLQEHPQLDYLAKWVRDIGIWGTVLITVYSGWTYIQRAVAMYRIGLGSAADRADD